MRKYKKGGEIYSLDNLACQEGAYQYINGHWRYMDIGWVVSYQLKYILNEMNRGHFAYAIKLGDENEKI